MLLIYPEGAPIYIDDCGYVVLNKGRTIITTSCKHFHSDHLGAKLIVSVKIDFGNSSTGWHASGQGNAILSWESPYFRLKCCKIGQSFQPLSCYILDQ